MPAEVRAGVRISWNSAPQSLHLNCWRFALAGGANRTESEPQAGHFEPNSMTAEYRRRAQLCPPLIECRCVNQLNRASERGSGRWPQQASDDLQQLLLPEGFVQNL